MEYRTVGNSGLRVSAVGIGGNNFGRKGTRTESLEGTVAVVKAALDADITTFDLADIYGATPGLAETLFGQALVELGVDAEDLVIITKFGMSVGNIYGRDYGARGSRKYMIRALEGSLERLGREYIDLYFYHTPDGVTPAEETLSALDQAVRDGKIRYTGTSNHSGWQLADAEHLAEKHRLNRYIATESHYNLLDRRAELEIVPAAQRFNLGIFPYFPLANGLLTGKYSKNQYPVNTRLTDLKPDILAQADWEQLEQFANFAADRDLSCVQLAMSWLASRPQVCSVIAGATNPQQVTENAQAVSWVPSEADEDELNRIFPAPAKIALF